MVTFEDKINNGYYKLNGEDFLDDAIAEVLPYLHDSALISGLSDDNIKKLAQRLVEYAKSNMEKGGEFEVWFFIQELLEIYE